MEKNSRLGGNNILLVASVVGIIPFCFVTEYHNPNSSPSIEKLHERFNIGRTSACVHKFLSSLAAHMISNSSYSDIRTAEQTCCKSNASRVRERHYSQGFVCQWAQRLQPYQCWNGSSFGSSFSGKNREKTYFFERGNVNTLAKSEQMDDNEGDCIGNNPTHRPCLSRTDGSFTQHHKTISLFRWLSSYRKEINY